MNFLQRFTQRSKNIQSGRTCFNKVARVNRAGQAVTWMIVSLASISAIGAAGWSVAPSTHVSDGSGEFSCVIDCEFDRFRQILVRKNATKAIVERGDMKLINEKLIDLKLDTSNDHRPLLNALRGKSRTQVDAEKLLCVSVNDPNITASELNLQQKASIHLDKIGVETKLGAPADNLHHYTVILRAVPDGNATRLTVLNELQVANRLPFFLCATADQRVNQAADRIARETGTAICDFIGSFEDIQHITPDLANN